jgi:hypothetical protein
MFARCYQVDPPKIKPDQPPQPKYQQHMQSLRNFYELISGKLALLKFDARNQPPAQKQTPYMSIGVSTHNKRIVNCEKLLERIDSLISLAPSLPDEGLPLAESRMVLSALSIDDLVKACDDFTKHLLDMLNKISPDDINIADLAPTSTLSVLDSNAED